MTRQRSILLFESAIKSESAKKSYLYQLKKFRIWCKIKNYDGLLQAPTKQIQELLEDYVMYLKNKVSPNSVPIYFAPIELFYVMNDVNLNFKKIRKMFPSKVKKGNNRGYTRKEIQTILSRCINTRQKALVLLLASSGCRIGAIPKMRLKHLTRIESSYCILIYENEKEEDYVFTTDECGTAIDNYLDERKRDGEYVDDESPLFRTSYRLGIEKVKVCNEANLTQMTGILVKKIQRKKTTKTNRFDVAKNHGFRKFYATAIKDVDGISPTMTEKLINHVGVTQLDGSYYKPTKEKMFESYKKCIDVLTIDDTNRNKIKLEQKDKRILEFEEKEHRINELEKRMRMLEKVRQTKS